MGKTILVLGGTGMLGHVLVKELEKESQFNVYNIVRENKLNDKSIICDVLNIEELKKSIEKVRPEIIINCIGLLKEQSNLKISKAIYLNSYLPQWLLEYCEHVVVALSKCFQNVVAMLSACDQDVVDILLSKKSENVVNMLFTCCQNIINMLPKGC